MLQLRETPGALRIGACSLLAEIGKNSIVRWRNRRWSHLKAKIPHIRALTFAWPTLLPTLQTHCYLPSI